MEAMAIAREHRRKSMKQNGLCDEKFFEKFLRNVLTFVFFCGTM